MNEAVQGERNGGFTRALRATGKAVPEDARRHNRSLVLQSLFDDGPLSRADLARATHLTPTTTSDLVAGLLEEGLVEDVGQREVRGVGKPATLVGIVPDARHILTLDVSADDNVHGAVVNLIGKVLHRRTVPRQERTGADAVALVTELARELTGVTDRPILGVGVGSPGIVDPAGEVVEAANLGWHDLPLARELSTALALPVHVVNDANAATLAEYALGDESTDNLLLVKVGKGVGAGLLIDGSLFTGDRFAAGEIGHVTVDERGEPCACGRRGCLETAIAVPRLQERLAAARDERERRRVLEAAGRRLGLALATVVSALNLDDVVLSGPADVLGEAFRAAALATIRRRTIASVGEHVTLRYDSLGDDDVLLGAAVLVRSVELGVA
jgi:predicted NBD/HSP70 family sugar kinase